MNYNSEAIALIFLPLILQDLAMLIAMLLDPNVDRKRRTLMVSICVLILVLLVQDYFNHAYSIGTVLSPFRLPNSILGYCLTPFILYMFVVLVEPDRKHHFLTLATAINAVVYLTAFFSSAAFTFSDTNDFVRGPLGYTSHLVSWLMLSWLGLKSFESAIRSRVSEAIIPVACTLLLLAGTIADMNTSFSKPVSYITIMIVSACLLFYIWLRLQFAREHEEAILAEHRIRVMVSQIQPHFLFNTLSTIQALCHTNPEKAFETTSKFGSYLRQNISSLEHPGLIPLQEEINHTKIYSDIEAIRFPKITVEYDIQDDKFSVPPLSIQPLVENSIRHGVRSVPEGRVTISTRRTDGYHMVEIVDNGIGFDQSVLKDDTRDHIGIRNVRERIERMCGGTMKIVSSSETGTAITIMIPENRGGVPRRIKIRNAGIRRV